MLATQALRCAACRPRGQSAGRSHYQGPAEHRVSTCRAGPRGHFSQTALCCAHVLPVLHRHAAQALAPAKRLHRDSYTTEEMPKPHGPSAHTVLQVQFERSHNAVSDHTTAQAPKPLPGQVTHKPAAAASCSCLNPHLLISSNQYWRIPATLFINAGAVHVWGSLATIWVFGSFLIRSFHVGEVGEQGSRPQQHK